MSELNIKVREHRRKMGLLSTPPPASHLHAEFMQEHMTGVKSHLEEACQEALSHMRRDVLWKRMVYGQVVGEGSRGAQVRVELLCEHESLNCVCSGLNGWTDLLRVSGTARSSDNSSFRNAGPTTGSSQETVTQMVQETHAVSVCGGG